MSEPIVVDMALAYKQMSENPELLDQFSKLLQAAMPTYEEVFSGWVVRTRSRTLDVDKNPNGVWSKWTYQTAFRTANPYVYQKGKHNAKNKIIEHIQYDYSNPPVNHSNAKYGSIQYEAWRSEYGRWHSSRPIKGYLQHETQVVPAKIVVQE